MTTLANGYTFDQVLARAYDMGKAEGAGLSTPIENAKFVFEASMSCDMGVKNLQAFYVRYAEGKNDGNKNGHKIDLSEKNKKSLEGQASKLGIFRDLAKQNGGVHHDLIDR